MTHGKQINRRNGWGTASAGTLGRRKGRATGRSRQPSPHCGAIRWRGLWRAPLGDRKRRRQWKGSVRLHYTVRPQGPIAQRLEQRTHNPLVPGSNPGGPTNPASYVVLYVPTTISWPFRTTYDGKEGKRRPYGAAGVPDLMLGQQGVGYRRRWKAVPPVIPGRGQKFAGRVPVKPLPASRQGFVALVLTRRHPATAPCGIPVD